MTFTLMSKRLTEDDQQPKTRLNISYHTECMNSHCLEEQRSNLGPRGLFGNLEISVLLDEHTTKMKLHFTCGGELLGFTVELFQFNLLYVNSIGCTIKQSLNCTYHYNKRAIASTQARLFGLKINIRPSMSQ